MSKTPSLISACAVLVLAAGAAWAQGAPAAAPGAGAAGAEGAYAARLRTLSRDVDELSERVVRLRGKLNLLKDTVLGGAMGSARCVIRYKNEMGSTFRLIRAVYALDGIQILSKSDDSGRMADMAEFDVYNGAIQPGSHTLTVQLTYQGHGLGVFSYLKNYKFDVRSSHNFLANDGQATIVTVAGYEKPGADVKMEDKPAVEFRVKLVGRDAVEPPPAAKK